ncbi:MAG: M48 family metallopeptidase [Clostridia bacterium]|nr:M48 family metallopeptidase [Clostridia bacterium]
MERSVNGLKYTLRYDKRSKHIRIKVLPPDGEIAISCPFYTPIERVESFLISNLNWVEKARVKVLNNASGKSYFDGGNTLSLFGKNYTVIEKEDKRYSLTFGIDFVVISYPNGADIAKRVSYVKRYYKAIALNEFTSRINYWQEVIGVKAIGFGLRFMRSRWGSCSVNTRHINFSVYAIEKPIEYLDYLVVHELVHLLHPNHSPIFHNTVKKYLPNADKLRKLRG